MPRSFRLLLVALLITALAIGAVILIYGTPEQRLRNAFHQAGLSEPLADCMAERLADRLSYRQMWRLGGLSKLRDGRAVDMSLTDMVTATRGLRDREVVAITARSAVACGLEHGHPRLSISL